ncbi:MAG: signal peptidase I [Acidimicrobiia bacterium]|nr:signal peptidase I [Acidimicrobiia bacterium]
MSGSSRPRAAAKMAIGAAVAATAAAAVRGKLARFEIVENSMEPAMSAGDYVVAIATKSPLRGQIVVFPDPILPARSLTKRVVGLAGETITITAGQVGIDGEILAEPWADGPTLPDGEWHCPPGTVFVLGDNRRLSSGDGRALGPLRVESMYRVVFRYWPIGAIGRP